MLSMRYVLLLVFCCCFLGCGDRKAVIPTTEFTEEQKAAIKAEDAKIADEESHGTVKKTKK